MEQITSRPPRPIERPVMLQRWSDLTYLHWPYPVDAVAPLLPAGVAVDTFDGAAWVGLVPFVMRDLRPPWLPALPWVSTFVEINVRTYVVDPVGRRAVWFFSLDVPRLGAVAVARAAYGLPYMWARCRFEADGSRYRYTSTRRWPGPRGAHIDATIERGAPSPADELVDFLTARWGLVSGSAGRLRHAPVDHPPWPLCTGEVRHLDEDLVAAAGLPEPVGPPLVHVSPGVDVRVAGPHPVGAGFAPTPTGYAPGS